MKKVLYPGTFDPITLGHVDVILKAVRLFDEVIIGVSGQSPKETLFQLEERISLVQLTIKELSFQNLRALSYTGLTVDFAKQLGCCAIIRGLRAVSDFESEFQLALMNRRLEPKIETIFLMPEDNHIYLSSSLVKEISRLGGDISPFVPVAVVEALKQKMSKRNSLSIISQLSAQ
ncbi:pantetheine-phosphate adenylyltransferase [Candidatus Methylacidiphilum fumarolicum]|uniref:Phosphopantetheine adenylyltransferase n=2 Tax=Candidatus Methylacidiphilum fumarolicum TaxID=591154 RepID=I0K006_METFB|nr:pantetheine-phosphate adenylyltransferase [Candidatus Methylacidiphilum fumarolicum]MBW6415150.1 pantetheine-phosphate adenylyltransferase [Candidatus Methylacidiphilum fumarolicum]TFE65970.1 pantetheine-phosphate adenylyltransferase [Candidatus Methylacidiphilum fumarolicum]TFE72702.1 pantetheine-phosphate adenylyltransferase [Candidatus Methylacidiphilum fumarolicum]TFE73167.1 pantetheine-phosphate adenylyltransferase [Candidatus Methylacidiphilum fumarolicum]TFE77570.1 pantetheine-phosph